MKWLSILSIIGLLLCGIDRYEMRLIYKDIPELVSTINYFTAQGVFEMECL